MSDIGYVQAAGGGGSVFDLKWSFVNFLILAAFIIWKAKKPLSEMFRKNSSDVEYLYRVAQERDKESNMKYEEYRKKMEFVDKEYNAVLERFSGKGVDFAREQKQEEAVFIEKLRKEKDRKVAVEKSKRLKEVENTLMANVIFEARKRIEKDLALKNQITKGLLSKIG